MISGYTLYPLVAAGIKYNNSQVSVLVLVDLVYRNQLLSSLIARLPIVNTTCRRISRFMSSDMPQKSFMPLHSRCQA